jgi:hypothetical protein
MKKWKFVIPLLIVIVMIFFISGYRFSALSAAKSNSFIANDAKLLEKYNSVSSVFFYLRAMKKRCIKLYILKSQVCFS